jgi:hypothetical protein
MSEFDILPLVLAATDIWHLDDGQIEKDSALNRVASVN